MLEHLTDAELAAIPQGCDASGQDSGEGWAWVCCEKLEREVHRLKEDLAADRTSFKFQVKRAEEAEENCRRYWALLPADVRSKLKHETGEDWLPPASSVMTEDEFNRTVLEPLSRVTPNTVAFIPGEADGEWRCPGCLIRCIGATKNRPLGSRCSECKKRDLRFSVWRQMGADLARPGIAVSSPEAVAQFDLLGRDL